MFTIYVYVLDTLADWELGHVTAELYSGRFFKKEAERISVKTVSCSKEPIHTMGGLTVVPDCWMNGGIPAMDKDFWKCFRLLIREKLFTWMSRQ